LANPGSATAQWRTQNFRMGGVEVLQGWAGVGRDPPPHWGRV